MQEARKQENWPKEAYIPMASPPSCHLSAQNCYFWAKVAETGSLSVAGW